ncbi:MAG: TVP38/TMEM64 family inner membrane protein YdjZ [Firmicutes bacterium ADurb.Bin300]|jgi:uncharacterized membrane protein YdjX (TVP38/TMEM64 family)|nr:MAG: TVP38/TMEM64 family inner membrane protein YdjZ [Firmicutes bacterium ADurb.Bin300]
MEKSIKLKRIFVAVQFALLIALSVIAYIKFGKEILGFINDEARFKAWLDGYKAFGAVIFVGIRAFQTVIKIIPAEPLEIAAGYVYGTAGGGALCLLGSVLGSLVILALTRTFGKRLIDWVVPGKTLEKYALLNDEKKLIRTLFIIYLIPSTPKDIITYLSGFLKIKPVKFMLITSIARIPSIITSTLCGAQLGNGNVKLAAAVFIGTLAAGVIGMALYESGEKKRKKKCAKSLAA